jgi:outer membrane protein insertion porin family
MAWQDEQRQRRMMGEYQRSSRMLSSLVRTRLPQSSRMASNSVPADHESCCRQIEDNFDAPMTLSALRVTGTVQTRASFLAALLKPSLATTPETLGDLLRLTQATQQALAPWGIFKQIDVRLETPQSLLAEKGAVDLVVDVKESGRLMLKSGTEVGQGEGSAVRRPTRLTKGQTKWED